VHRLAQRARQYRRRPAYLASRGVSREMITALVRSAFRAGATCWPPSSSPSGYTSVKTISSSQSPPTARPCTRASSPERSSATGPTGSRSLSSPGPRRARSRRGRRPCPGLLRPRPEPDLQPWLLHLVEQQGVSLEEFEVRRDQSFWRGLLDLVPVWDDLITELNGDRARWRPPEASAPAARPLTEDNPRVVLGQGHPPSPAGLRYVRKSEQSPQRPPKE